MMQRTSSVHAHQHAVKFYGSDDSLFGTIATFLAEGLITGNPALILATPVHSRGILDALEARLIDVGRAQRAGELVVRDAEEVLAQLVVDGVPDRAMFEEHVGGLIESLQLRRGGALVRAYGEMVNVLWKDGQTDAAIRLEMLWNSLAQTHRFTLLCGYAMGHFYKQSTHYLEVCQHHQHVIEPETTIVRFPPRRTRRAGSRAGASLPIR